MSILDKDLFLIESGSMTNDSFKRAMRLIPGNAIVAIEEIDTIGKSRDIRTNLEKKVEKSLNLPSSAVEDGDLGLLGIEGLLNGLDGLTSGEGYIVVATTNYPEKLDPALIRDGRFDLHLEIGYMTDETLHRYMRRIYGDIDRLEDWCVAPGLAPSKLQRLVFNNRTNPIAVLEKIAYNKLSPLKGVEKRSDL